MLLYDYMLLSQLKRLYGVGPLPCMAIIISRKTSSRQSYCVLPIPSATQAGFSKFVDNVLQFGIV